MQIAKMDKKVLISWVLTLGLPLMVLMIPTNADFTPTIRNFFVITLLAIMTFIFDNVPRTVVAVMLPVSYVVCGIAPAGMVFSVWAGDVIWMILGGLILASILEKSGLLKRIAYKCIALTGATYKGIIVGLGLTGIILTLIIPGSAFMPIAALSYGICQALDLKKGREAAGIMLSGAVLSLAPHLFLYNPHSMIVFGVAEPVTGHIPVTWGSYFLNNWVNIAFFVIMMVLMIIMYKPKVQINGKEFFESELKAMGKLKINEKKSIAVCALLIALLLTTNIHGISSGWIFATVPLLLYLPGIGFGTEKDLMKIDYGFILFVAACMAIGGSATALGIGDIIAKYAIPMLTGKHFLLVLIVIYLLCFVLNFFLTPLAIWSAFACSFVTIAIQLGINAEPVLYLMYNGTDQVLMPYEYAYYLLFFSFNLIPLKDFVKVMSVKTVVNFLCVFLILIPYWQSIGILLA